MALLTIPKGTAFEFSVTIKDTNSFEPKDLTGVTDANLRIVSKDTGILVTTTDMTVVDADNGRLACSIPTAETNKLEVVKGDKEDRSYSIPNYDGIITVTFSNSANNMTVIIRDIAVINAGV